MKLHDRYRSDFYFGKAFKPLDSTSQEGRAELREHLEKALSIRKAPPSETRTRMRIHYDRNGIFAKPIIAENVIVACDRLDAHTKRICKKFCELYLKTDDGSNSISFTSHAGLETKDSYRAVIWVRGGEEEVPFEEKNMFYGITAGGKPVYVIEQETIDACRNRDLDSRQTLARLEMVHDAEEL